MSSRRMSLLPRATLHSDSEHHFHKSFGYAYLADCIPYYYLHSFNNFLIQWIPWCVFLTWLPIYIIVSLPWEWIQEIKCMMTVYSTNCLFISCTQKSHLYLHSTQIFNIHIVYKQFYCTPCKNNKKTPTYLEGQLLARSDEFPSTLVPYLVTTAPPLAFAPLTSYPPLSPHYTIYNDGIHNHSLLRPGQ
jgi:hypothetical protein